MDRSAGAQSEFSVPDAYHPARTLVLFEAFAALALFVLIAWRRRAAAERRVLLLGGGIFMVGFLLRVFGAQWAWLHENRHGYGYLLEILSGEPGYLPPSTYYVLMNFATWVGPPTEGTIFWMNVVTSAATVPLVGLVSWQLSRCRTAGWLGMLFWALAPYPIRMAATEIYFNVGLFFFLAALAATVAALRRVDDGPLPIGELALAALCTVLAAQTRAPPLLWPATVLLVALGAVGRWDRRRWVAWGGLALGITFLLLPKVFLHLGAGAGGGRYLEPVGVYTNLRRLTALDPRVVSPVLAPLALVGAVLLIRGRRALGRLPTLGLALLAALPGATWLGLLTTSRRCDGFICLASMIPQTFTEALPLALGAALAMALTWQVARRRGAALPGLPEHRRSGLTSLGLLLPLVTAAMITGAQVARLRFDLVPTGLLAVLAGIGAAGLIEALPRRNALRASLIGLMVASTVIPAAFLWQPYADSLEHRFLRSEVLPVLADVHAPRLVFPHESEKSRVIKPEWWRLHLDDAEVVHRLTDLEQPSDPSPVYALIGYTCAWNHGRGVEGRYIDEEGVAWDTPPPYPPAAHIEGAPPIHPACAAALAGRSWQAVVTREVPIAAMAGNVARVYPGIDAVVIGLYRSTGSVETLHTP